MDTSRLEVGRIDRAHGLRGEVVVALTTDREERVAPGSVLWAGAVALTVLASRAHQGRWIVAFGGVGDRDAADALRGLALSAEPLDAQDGTIWVHELVGATAVLVDGTTVGTVIEVQANPAHDLLVLDSGALVPAVFVTDTSALPVRVVLDPPEGLFDLTGPDAD